MEYFNDDFHLCDTAEPGNRFFPTNTCIVVVFEFVGNRPANLLLQLMVLCLVFPGLLFESDLLSECFNIALVHEVSESNMRRKSELIANLIVSLSEVRCINR